MWLKLLHDISQKSTMGIRNSCNISFLEICWFSVIVLESCTPSAQKPHSACCIEEASICLTSMHKWSVPFPQPTDQWCPGRILAARCDHSCLGTAPRCCLLPTGREAGRKLGGFLGLSEPEDNQHHSWTMCPRECISAPSEHTQSTQ